MHIDTRGVLGFAYRHARSIRICISTRAEYSDLHTVVLVNSDTNARPTLSKLCGMTGHQTQ